VTRLNEIISIVASGEKWIGYGIGTIYDAIMKTINFSKNSLVMTIFVVTDKSIIKAIKKALERGVFINIYYYSLINNTFHQKNISALKKLSEKYSHLILNDVEDVLHAKVLIGDEEKVVLSSANFSYGGFYSNYEIGVVLSDVTVAHKMITLFRRLEKK